MISLYVLVDRVHVTELIHLDPDFKKTTAR